MVTTTATATAARATTTTVLVAGASGMLGSRIATHLLAQDDTDVRLLVHDAVPADPAKAQVLETLVGLGATAVLGDVLDPPSLESATAGIDTVVSALQGGPGIILDGQVALAKAAARNGVRRFLPSDFAIDLFAAPEGAPQFDMRRRAAEEIEALQLEVVHVLNGAFMDLMFDPARPGLIDLSAGTVTLWGSGDEPFDLTTVEDTARFTALAATDPNDLSGRRYLSGARASFNEIITETERLTGTRLTRNVLGSADDLRRLTAAADDPWTVIPQWYFLALLTVPPFPTTDNDRYPGAHPTGLHDYLAGAHRALATT